MTLDEWLAKATPQVTLQNARTFEFKVRKNERILRAFVLVPLFLLSKLTRSLPFHNRFYPLPPSYHDTMSGKRPGSIRLGDMVGKKTKLGQQLASTAAASSARPSRRPSNPYLSHPVAPEAAIQKFFMEVRSRARRYLLAEKRNNCEVEARLGILKVPHEVPDRRVTSTGAKPTAHAFDCSCRHHNCSMVSGVSRSHFAKGTGSGLSEVSPLTKALNVHSADELEKGELVETEVVETVYTGYANGGRVCFAGEHPSGQPLVGKMESKEKLMHPLDLALPAANFDLRVSLSSEKPLMGQTVIREPPAGWSSKRIKYRRSYSRRDKSIKWQIDVTEVTTIHNSMRGGGGTGTTEVDYEIEVELLPQVLLQLLNENDEAKLKTKTTLLAQELWWIVKHINPLRDALDVEESLRDHPNKKAVQVALAQCGAFKKFMDSSSIHSGGHATYDSPIGKSTPPSPALANVKFVGSMPVNFRRHNIKKIKGSASNEYFLSEKTDGVRYFMVFTGDTVVLVGRDMKGKQPIPMSGSDPAQDPFAPIMKLIKPGTVFDGEVVMNRRPGRKPRPVYIVFDILAISTTQPVLQLPFEQRLRHLRQATFRTATANRDMFDPRFVADTSVALPLVRKNFVKRTKIGELLSHVHEESGMRCYRNGELHNHLTDGIIFQPNRPYFCGTDQHLLKWKYLDTVTIDVEMLQLRHNDDDDTLRVGCLFEEQRDRVDMTRDVKLPKSERMRLEADKFEAGDGRIVEVGFYPDMGEWYYLTMRGDKEAPNHISTVNGSLLELAEGLTVEELRYCMSVPAGTGDMSMRIKLKEIADNKRRWIQAEQTSSSSSNGHQ